MKILQAREIAKEYQARLGLHNWELIVRWMSTDEREEMPEHNGFSMWNPEYNVAVVVLARDGEHIKHTIIHELLHLRLQGHDYMPTKRSLSTEATINALCKALL